jgi:hypothetical protein
VKKIEIIATNAEFQLFQVSMGVIAQCIDWIWTDVVETIAYLVEEKEDRIAFIVLQLILRCHVASFAEE